MDEWIRFANQGKIEIYANQGKLFDDSINSNEISMA